MENGVVVGNCLDVMPALEAGSVDLAICDPPFGIGLKYDSLDDRFGPGKYYDWTMKWQRSVKRILKPTGSIFVMIGDEYAAEVRLVMDHYFHRRNWIIWSYSFGQHCSTKFGRSHTHIFYYTCDPKQFTFNADAVRVPSSRQTKYKDKRANPKGRVPGDVWDFPRICGTFKERAGTPCQNPAVLVERIVKACSNPGDLVFDPFAGSCSTLVAAKKLGRRYFGVELSESYAAIGRSLLEKTSEVQ